MTEAIIKIMLGGSLIGIISIVFRKIPILIEIPESEIELFDWKTPFGGLRKKIVNSKTFSPEIILQKLLSKIRVMTLRVGRKTEDQLQRLREKSKKRKIRENDNYWEEVRRTKGKKDD